MKPNELPSPDVLEEMLERFNQECSTHLLIKIPTESDPKRAAIVDDPEAELMSMIGLDDVKQAVLKNLCYHRIMTSRKAAGRKVPLRLTHMLLTGNPGTGKTTVARLIGRIYKKNGLLTRGNLVEANRGTMVGRYIGETEQRTRELIEEARGGILFIDEIYSLVEAGDDGSSRDFGMKAIDTLMTVLSEPKDDVMVIGAGYPDKIRRFVEANPGLASRFPNVISFGDYTEDHLGQIAMSEFGKYEFDLTQDAKGKMMDIILRARRMENFGNARFVVNLIHCHIIPNFCDRIVHDPNCPEAEKANMSTIEPQDIPSFAEVMPLLAGKNRKAVGFAN